MFSRAKLGYLLTLVLFLAAPMILGRVLSRYTIYKSLSVTARGAGDFAYIRKVIFEERGDIDILFAGTSKIWNAIAPEIIESEIAKRNSKRPLVLRSIAINWQGQDATYTLLRDLLSQRRVKMLVLGLTLPADPTLEMHRALYELWTRDQAGEFVINEFPPKDQISYWSTRIYEWPRKLLSTLRRDRPEPPNGHVANSKYGNYETQLMLDHSPFVDSVPSAPKFSTHEMLYDSASAGEFEVLDSANGMFLDRILDLTSAHGVHVVSLETPFLERNVKPKIHARFLSHPSPLPYHLLGITNKKLFAGLNDDTMKRLFYDPRHLNWNGTRYFSLAVAPALAEVFFEISNDRQSN